MPRSKSINVCAIPFIPAGAEDEIASPLLVQNKTEDQLYYDGFCAEVPGDPLDPESPMIAASYCVQEATGVRFPHTRWTEIVTLRGEDWEICFVYAIHDVFRDFNNQPGQGFVSVENPYLLPLNIIPTLRWLIPLVLDDTVNKPLGWSGVAL